MRNRAPFFVIALALASPGEGAAQQAPADGQEVAGIVVLEGPYELSGGGGVLGYVLKRIGTKVDFQSCIGAVLSVDDSLLKPTTLNCGDEPSTNPHPFNVACSTVASQVAVVIAKAGEDPKDAPLGTVFAQATDTVTKTLPSNTEGWGQWDAILAPPVTVCGDKYVYLPKVQFDQAWIGVVKNASQ
ncbi:hypothetical protein NKJ87_09435 [Mesorhizobium sp. M0027]|uniref:hypothetical protein n=1 Tax=Mesorhizobium sp. M0027 TaxID=2956848 RepID=UPI00333A0204